jgi:hypothetical protein
MSYPVHSSAFNKSYYVCVSYKFIQFLVSIDLYCSPNIVWMIKSRRMRWAGHVTHMGDRRGIFRVLVEKPEGKRSLGRARSRWEDNIKMDLQEVGCGGLDWMELAQDRERWQALVNAVTNLQVP